MSTGEHNIIPNENPGRNPGAQLPVPEKNRDLFNRLEILEGETAVFTSFRGGSQKRAGLKLALWTWLSASIDTLIVVSTSCFFIVIFSMIMKSSVGNLFGLISNNQNMVMVIATLFLISMWSYLIFMRVFMGASIGEWTCSLRIGEPLQRLKLNYIFRVMLRTTVVLLTGVVVLPVLSLILSRDIAGEISGIKIYSLQ